MLRSLIGTCTRVYTCSCLPVGCSRFAWYGASNQSLSLFHTAQVMQVLPKEVMGKRRAMDIARQSKEEYLEPLDDHEGKELEGITEAGVTYPTLETHQMLIDGVRYCELPIVHIKSSMNNTIINVTNHTGAEYITRSSCGAEGFKNVKKSTNVAAQATGYSIGNRLTEKGIKNVRVVVKGLGAGRLPSIKGLQMAGIQVISITDNTLVPNTKPRKARRL